MGLFSTKEEIYKRGIMLCENGQDEKGFDLILKAAHKGCLEAQIKVADRFYSMGIKIRNAKKNTEEEKNAFIYAYHYYEIAKEHDVKALFMCGKMCYYGMGVEKNTDEALNLLEKAASKGYEDANAFLAELYADKSNPKYDIHKVYNFYLNAGEDGKRKASEIDATIKASIEKGIDLYNKKNYKEAYTLLLEGAKFGNKTAQHYFSLMLLNGQVATYKEEDLIYLSREAQEDSDICQKFVLYCVQKATTFRKNGNNEKALFYYEKAAEYSDPEACYYCGLAYLNGAGVAKDKKRGIEFLEKIAEEENDFHDKAIEQIGKYYFEKGEYYMSCARNMKTTTGIYEVVSTEGRQYILKALMEFYNAADDWMYTPAMYKIFSLNVIDDYPEAIKYLKMAAERGDKRSADIVSNINYINAHGYMYDNNGKRITKSEYLKRLESLY